MNISMLVYMLGRLLRLEGVFMMIPFAAALIYGEAVGRYYLGTSLLLILASVFLSGEKPKKKEFFAKEGFVLVSLSWIVLSFFGALPFYLSGEIPSFTDAMFEIVSGFTTTGASILTYVEDISYASRIWRSFSHWVGGMGILVFMLAVLPITGENSMSIMQAESPGPSVGKLVPRLRTTAALLYKLYFFLTVLMFLLLALTGMPLFDNICITLGTAGTGGFSCVNSGQAGYTALQQSIITIFMTLFGINFNVYFLLYIRKYKDALFCEEMRVYLLVILSAVVLITINTAHLFESIPQAVHHVAFTVSSLITTTGYGTVDFDTWPQFSKSILLLLMMVGACAGSTGGGMKISRAILGAKQVRKEVGAVVHPRRVKVIKLEGKAISHEVMRAVNAYFMLYIAVLAASVILISLDNFGFMTNFSAVMATLNNIGPGMEQVGPTQNFSVYSDFSKWVLIFDMLAGRLELFPMFVLLSPSTWTKN